MDPSDRELIERSKGGDKDAFGDIVRRYMKRAYYAALAICGNDSDAMDLSQETFVRAFRGIKKFDTSRPFFPWYYRALKNLWINRMRKGRGVKVFSLSPRDDDRASPDLPSGQDGPFVAAHKSEMALLLAREMDNLAPEKREILYLRHFEHLSYREIAQTLAIPEGTVMSRLYAARAALRAKMEKYL